MIKPDTRVLLTAHRDSVWDGATGTVVGRSQLVGAVPFWIVNLDSPGDYAHPTVVVSEHQLTELTPITDDPAADRAARIARGRCVDCDDTRRWDDGTTCPTCR